MMAEYECTKRDCAYRRRENAAASYVSHMVKGDEHVMRKVVKS